MHDPSRSPQEELGRTFATGIGPRIPTSRMRVHDRNLDAGAWSGLFCKSRCVNAPALAPPPGVQSVFSLSPGGLRCAATPGYCLSGLRPARALAQRRLTTTTGSQLVLRFGCEMAASSPHIICVHLRPSAVNLPCGSTFRQEFGRVLRSSDLVTALAADKSGRRPPVRDRERQPAHRLPS